MCEKNCVEGCEKNYIRNRNKGSLFSCVAIVCLCDEREYSRSNRFNITNDVFVLQSIPGSDYYFYFTLSFILGLIVIVIYYESNKTGELFSSISKEDINNLGNFGKSIEAKKREERSYDYVLLNDQQIEI